jgi:hypothetical protein
MNNTSRTISLDWPWQSMHSAFHSSIKYATIRSCRRSFKTAGAVRWIVEELISRPNSKGIWVDTINKNIDRYYERYFKPIIGDLADWNYQKKTLKFVNGSYLDFGSAESPENMEGFEYDFGAINEAGIILKKDAIWDNTLVPMLKYAIKVRIFGTPKGKNKFHKLCHIEDEEWSHYHYTVRQCPFYSLSEIARIKQRTPELVWRQEYLAEFIDGAGDVFRNIQLCIDNNINQNYRPTGRYVMSIDLAKHVDFTVIYIADANTNQVVFQDRFNKIDWNFQKKRIYRLYQKWNIEKCIIDSTGVGDTIHDDLVAAGMSVESFKFTATSKTLLVQNLAVAIDNKGLTFYPFPELFSELEIYGYEVSASGNIRYNAPNGYHDDCVMSLALMNKLLSVNIINYEELLHI